MKLKAVVFFVCAGCAWAGESPEVPTGDWHLGVFEAEYLSATEGYTDYRTGRAEMNFLTIDPEGTLELLGGESGRWFLSDDRLQVVTDEVLAR
ncbi:MAG: hypothetical protein ACQKBU_09060, partial [Verrucomicrobiales bacterium]